MSRTLLTLFSLLIFGCSSSSDDKTPPSSSKQTAPVQPTTPPGESSNRTPDLNHQPEKTQPASPVQPASPKVEDPIPGVPALAANPVSPEARTRGNALNRDGLEQHRTGDLDTAIATYKRALVADPSHRFARYNLASALVTVADHNAALTLLAEFRALGCQMCLERLRRAPQDGEWKPLWKNSRFVALTDVDDEGPIAEVVVFALVPDDGDGKGLRAQAILEPAPGWARAPALDIQVKVAGKTVQRQQLAPEDIQEQWVYRRLALPKQAFSVTLLVNGKRFGTLKAKPEDMRAEGYPDPIVRPVARPENVGRCHGVECPRFPAISADGRYLVSRDEVEAVGLDAMCSPPGVVVTSFQNLGDTHPSASRDLDGWEPLSCGSDKVPLPDGHTAEVDAPEAFVAIYDADGNVVHQQDVDGMDQELCVSKKHRILVVRTNEGIGGDCDELPVFTYTGIAY